MAMLHNPALAAAMARGVLAHGDDPTALAEGLVAVHPSTALELTVYDAHDHVLATTIAPPLAKVAGDQTWTANRMTISRPRGGAYAVVALVAGPSMPLHIAALFCYALLLAFLVVAAPLTRSIVRPIERLGRLARELGEGNLAVRANSTRRDEIGDLARSFDTMAGQISRLRAAERELLGDVSHELRTPLARMRVVLELAAGADHERARTYLSEIAAAPIGSYGRPDVCTGAGVEISSRDRVHLIKELTDCAGLLKDCSDADGPGGRGISEIDIPALRTQVDGSLAIGSGEQ